MGKRNMCVNVLVGWKTLFLPIKKIGLLVWKMKNYMGNFCHHWMLRLRLYGTVCTIYAIPHSKLLGLANPKINNK